MEKNNLYIWQERYEKAKTEFEEYVAQMKKNQAQYDGTLMPDKGKEVKVIYNFTKELIESAIDSSIPYPKVEPRVKSEKNEELARKIEAMLVNEVKRINFDTLNDLDERTTKIMGGNVALVEWNNRIKTHSTVGDIDVRLVSPTRFIPQDGVYELDRMDYFFLDFDDTKENIKKIYNVDIDAESLDPDRTDEEAEDCVTQKWALYKNQNGGIGAFSWVGDVVLIDDENYQQRAKEVCSVCGLSKPIGESKCSCGSTKWEQRKLKYEELTEDVLDAEGNVLIPAMSIAKDEYGNYKYQQIEEPVYDIDPLTGEQMPVYDQIFDDMMNPIGEQQRMQMVDTTYEEPTKIPYYVPKHYPVAIRKNVSALEKVFGDSDAEMIFDAQDQANKLATRLIKKAHNNSQILSKLKRSSFNFENDLMILELDSPDELAAIKSFDLRFDVGQEINLINQLYFWAKSLLGINDSSQGKQDTTATSGRAKEAQISRAQARQASKIVMKNAFYQDIYQAMFEFALAYMDEPREYPFKSNKGDEEAMTFNRYEFLEQDEYGNWFYNDNFYITTDSQGSNAESRQYNLDLMLADFQAGLYGNPQDPETILDFWKDRESMNYPNAKRHVARWQEKVDKMQEQQEEMMLMQELAKQQAQQQAMGAMPMDVTGGITNEM